MSFFESFMPQFLHNTPLNREKNKLYLLNLIRVSSIPKKKKKETENTPQVFFEHNNKKKL